MLIFIISIAAGIIGGMGIGGGTILIPSLTIFLSTKQQIAQSVNLISFIPTAIVALISHLKQGNIEKSLILKLSIGGIGGAIIGSYLAVHLSSIFLRKAFGVFLFVMGVYEVCCKNKCKKNKGAEG